MSFDEADDKIFDLTSKINAEFNNMDSSIGAIRDLLMEIEKLVEDIPEEVREEHEEDFETSMDFLHSFDWEASLDMYDDLMMAISDLNDATSESTRKFNKEHGFYYSNKSEE